MPIIPVIGEVIGMQTDPPADQMPRGYMRRILDFIPRTSIAPLRRRGGWSYASGTAGTTGSVKALGAVWAPFSNGAKGVLYNSEDGIRTFPDIVGGATTSITTVTNLIGVPIWHRWSGAGAGGGLVILPRGDIGVSTKTPKKYDGSTVADLGGSPPECLIAASWGDYLILAQNYDDPKLGNRMYFSGVGNPESWPANNSIDFPGTITAVVPRGKTIFVFTADGCHILRGDTPPPGGNMSLDKFTFSQGCPAQYATATYKDYVIWANANGVFKSDGSQPVDLTKLGGISTYWPYVYFPSSGDRITIGVYKNFLFCTVTLSPNGTVWKTMVYDLERNSWWEMSNISAYQYFPIATAPGTNSEDLLFVATNPTGTLNGRIGKISDIFDYTSNPSDAIGNFSPALLTPIFDFGSDGYKRIRKTFWEMSTDSTSSPNGGQLYYSLQGELDTPAVQGGDIANYWSPHVGAQTNLKVRQMKHLGKKFQRMQFYWTAAVQMNFALFAYDVELTALDPQQALDAHT